MGKKHKNRENQKTKQCLKLDYLTDKNAEKFTNNFKLDQKLIVNISSHKLTETQNNVLALGLNFATNPNEVLYVSITLATEQVTNFLQLEEHQQLKETIKTCLQKYKWISPTTTLNHEEREAIKSLKKEEGVIILPVDKGNSTVVMDIDQYTSRMKELLDQDNYEIIKRNPTDTLVTSIK